MISYLCQILLTTKCDYPDSIFSALSLRHRLVFYSTIVQNAFSLMRWALFLLFILLILFYFFFCSFSSFIHILFLQVLWCGIFPCSIWLHRKQPHSVSTSSMYLSLCLGCSLTHTQIPLVWDWMVAPRANTGESENRIISIRRGTKITQYYILVVPWKMMQQVQPDATMKIHFNMGL